MAKHDYYSFKLNPKLTGVDVDILLNRYFEQHPYDTLVSITPIDYSVLVVVDQKSIDYSNEFRDS